MRKINLTARAEALSLGFLTWLYFILGRILVGWSHIKICFYPAGGLQQIFSGPTDGFICPASLQLPVWVELQRSAGCTSHGRSQWQWDLKCFAKHWWHDFTSKSDAVFLFKLQIKALCLLDGGLFEPRKRACWEQLTFWTVGESKGAKTSHNPSPTEVGICESGQWMIVFPVRPSSALPDVFIQWHYEPMHRVNHARVGSFLVLVNSARTAETVCQR